MDRYNELKRSGRIAFTTFHQSYGYEEFIEGIKPVMSEDGSVGYKIEDGVFKKFCIDAGVTRSRNKALEDISNSAQVWCVHLGGSGHPELKRKCFAENTIRIGWNEADEIVTESSTGISPDDRRTVLYFQDEMVVGDIVLSFNNVHSIDGIGIIESDASFDEAGDYHYPRRRSVRWLVKNKVIEIKELNGGVRIDIPTINPMKRITAADILKLIADEKLMDDVSLEVETKPYVFIIDEINRGNISKIFGELITLIEPTKRSGMDEAMSARLPYSGKDFSVPSNVYILGTMNTADRSIALMDTALRRRFQFVEMMPQSNVLREIGADQVEDLDVARMLDVINERITFLYDREHTIGHAFFTGLRGTEATIDKLASIFEKSVIPLLQEYFYEDYQKIQLVLGDNAKSDSRYKFILDEDVKPNQIFKGHVEDVIDLPEKKYSINTDALRHIESYKEII